MRASSEGVAQESALRLAARQFVDGDDVVAVCGIVKSIAGHVGAGCSHHAVLFGEADGGFRRVGVFSGFHFNEDEDVAVVRDEIELAEP